MGAHDAAAGKPGTFIYRQRVQPAWIDYNGHLNVAYYVLIFDQATDAVFERLELGAAYRESSNRSVFVSDMFVAYRREILAEDEVRVVSRLVQHNAKRVVLVHEMDTPRLNAIAAVNEVMCVHVDLGRRRAVAWSPAAADAIAACIRAAQVPDADPPNQHIRLAAR